MNYFQVFSGFLGRFRFLASPFSINIVNIMGSDIFSTVEWNGNLGKSVLYINTWATFRVGIVTK